MIPGTSKILSKSGPGTLLTITKMLQKIQEKLWNHPGKVLFMSIWDIKKSENFSILDPPNTYFCFELLGPPAPQKDKFVQAFSKNLSVVDSWYFRTIIFLKLLKHK